MNKVYRVLWSKVTQSFVAVAEIVKSTGKGSLRSSLQGAAPVNLRSTLDKMCAVLAGVGWCWSAAFAQSVAPTQLPSGGQVAAGSALISQTPNTLAINQSSARAVINWQSFNIGSQAKVNITQPSSSSVLLNRILGNSASQIFGQINANGQVIMSNPAGLFFSPTASVDVGAFTATTHGIRDADFMAGAMKYSRNGATGKIINEGQIVAGLGGYVALLAPEVRNNGLVVAKLGTVTLAAGETFELEFDKQHALANILVTPSTISALVENGQAVQAPGGLIILSAQAAHQLQSGVVKNAGTLHATGLVSQGGVIRLSASHRIHNSGALLADAAPHQSGDGGTITAIADLGNPDSRIEVAGTWSAKGGDLGGSGGFIETSASRVRIQDGAQVFTLSPKGRSGTWLVDPTDFTIDSGSALQSTSGIGASTLQANLANTSVAISTNNSVGSDSGNLNVNASVTWAANTTLSLSAYRHVNVNADITATGVSGGLNLTANTGAVNGTINLGANVSTGGQQTYSGNVVLNTSNVAINSTGAGMTFSAAISATGAGGGNLTIASATNSNITGAVSSNIQLVKGGAGNLTLANASARYANASVASTTINAGSLTLQVDHPNLIDSNAVISGAGTLNIEPPANTSFNANVTTSSDLRFTINPGSLGGLNLGRTGNTANITLDNLGAITVTGPQGYYGRNVTLAGNASAAFTAWNNGATLTLSGIDAVNVLAPIAVSNVNSSIAIKTSQGTATGNNAGYYNFGLSAAGFAGRIDFSAETGQTFSTQDGTNSGNRKIYTFISSLTELRNASASANLALRTNIDASTFLQAGGVTPYASVKEGSFVGNFAGLGHTISNLRLNSPGGGNAGLFSQLGASVVQDIRFEAANITATNMNSLGTLAGYANNANVSGIMVANGAVNISSSGSWAGGIVGYTEGGMLRDVWVSNNPVRAISSGAGGIMGRSLMTVSNAHNLGSDVSSNGGEVGGLIGQHWNGLSLSRSDSSGNVTGGGHYLGGLVGNNWGGVTDSWATGHVTGNLTQDYQFVGGVIGYQYSGSLTNVTASGNVVNRHAYVGGVIGYARDNITLTNVSASGSVQSQAYGFTGGLIGYSENAATLSTVSYSGLSVSSGAGNGGIGGLIGYSRGFVSMANATVSKIGARINITSTGPTGGLIGWANVGVSISDSYVSNADITGGSYVGGLVGEQRRSTVQINRSYAGGSGGTNVIGADFVGGLVGEMVGGSVSNSYYAGNLTGVRNYGGIAGFLKPGAYLSNTFYNLDTSLINGNATLTIGGLYGAQYGDWANSNLANVSARTLTISNYFDIDGGYYTINTSNAVGTRNDLSNVMGFSQSLANGSVNSYKFKLTSHLDVATSTTRFIPYFSAAEFNGNGFQIQNFSWNAPTSHVGFLGAVHRSTVTGLQVLSTPYAFTGDNNAVNGQYYVGTAIGSMYGGVVVDSLAVLGGTTRGLDNTGGFMGYFSDGAMGNVSATRLASVTDVTKAKVVGSMTYSVDADQWQELRGNTGGLAGYVGSASVNQLNSNLEVAADGYRTGGLIGYLSVGNYSHASVTANTANNLSASGNVTSANQQTGGLIGRASGTATTSTNWSASGNVTGTDYVGGLVGCWTSGTFSNLSGTMANVTSSNTGGSVGGLAGYMASVTLSNASTTANVSGSGANTGGLVGLLDGANTLTNVSASGNVSTSSNYVGGLVGGLNGSSTIRNARFMGQSVTGNSYVGGLIGLANSATAEVYGSYVSTNVTATGDFVGGLAGFYEGKLGDSSNASSSAFGSPNNHTFATGNVTGRYDVGGLVGRLGSKAVVTNTYASVNITADSNFGGLIGHFSPGVEVTNSHYDMSANTITALTPSSPSARVVLNVSNGLLTIGGLYGPQYATWFNGGQLNGLASGGSNGADAYFGAPDAAGYYSISTTQHVKDYLGFADQSALKFRFDANLNLASSPGLYIPYVAGELNANGQTVSNLSLNQNTSNLGLIGHLRNNTSQAAAGLALSNLTVSGTITGVMNLGLAAGSDWQRNITQVSSAGSVTGTDIYYADKLAPNVDDRTENHNGWSNVGGVLGYGWGRETSSAVNLVLNNISSTANVTGVNAVGGMAGHLQYATVSNTTTSGAVTSVEKTSIGVYRTGGLVGQLSKTNSLLYASSHTQGLVKGVAYVGGLVGEMQGNLGEVVSNSTPTYSTFVSSNVEGKSERVGGLVGSHIWGTMTNAEMTGMVSGWTTNGTMTSAGVYTGGLGGYVSGNMNYLRYTGSTVMGSDRTGGVVGHNDSTVSFSSSVGNVSGVGAYVGGVTGYGSQLNNVTSSANVTGGTFTGGVSGQTGGSIANSSWTGEAVRGGHQSGGLVGNLGGAIDNSYATGAVISSSSYVGGLVGNTGNWVRNSYATGNVSGTDTIGGLAGYADWVSNSHASGNVSGTTNVGGLVGNLHQASNSYATGNVNGAGTSIGGFVGYARSDISNSQASGNVTANNSSYVGGFAGFNQSGTISNASATGYVYGADNTTLNYVGGFAGINQATIVNSSVNITAVHPDSSLGVKGTQRVGGFVGENNGTIVNSTSNAAVGSRGDYLGGFVGLMNSGSISNAGSWGTVSGPYSVGGFVGYQSGGTVQSSFSNAIVSASGGGLLVASSNRVGGFVGWMENGTITSSRAAGAVSGLGKVGGFAGLIRNSASLSVSYSTGAVTQTSTSNASTSGGVGGFAGYLDSSFVGTLSDVYAMGAVTGTQNVGGLIGYADRGTVNAGYATGMTTFNTLSVPNPVGIGGVIGGFNSTAGRVTATYLYWNTETSNQTVSGGVGVGLTTAQLKGTLTNTMGFNAANSNWNTSAGMFPYLNIFYPTQPRAIQGYAYLSDGQVAKRAQVGQYTGGTLLNGGTASTGVNGYFYSIVGSNTLFADSAIPESISGVTVDPANRGSGFSSAPAVSFVGGGGSGATAAASLQGSAIASINVTSAGSGYTSPPKVVLSGGGSNPTSPALNVTLQVPQFNTTQLATLLMLDGDVTVNSTVAGMSYTDRIFLNDLNAFIYKDGNTNVVEKVVQGITRLSTQNSSATGMNQDMVATMGASKQSSVAASLPTRSSLELLSRSSAFNLNTPLSYADNGVSNAGNITVTGNSQVTLSGGAFTSTKAQNYNALLTLGADATLSGTTITTNSTLNGGGYNLTVNSVAALNSGNWVSGGDYLNLQNLWVTGTSMLYGHVSSMESQTYNGAVTLNQDTTLTGSNVTLASGASVAGAGHSLDVVGNASIGGAVSSVSTMNVSGTTLLSANVTSAGNQTYAGAMSLGADATLVASAANAVILAAGTINGAQALTLNATGAGAQVVLNGVVGGTTALTRLTTNADSIRLNGWGVTTSGDQSYGGSVTLGQNMVLSSTSSGSVIGVTGAIDADVSASRSLTIHNAGGAVNLGGHVGGGTRLSELSVTGASIAWGASTLSTSGGQTYHGAVTLNQDTTLTGSNVTLASGASVAGAGHSLDVVGNASIGGAVSSVSTMNVSGTTLLGANVTSAGNQTYAGAMSLGADATLVASAANAVILANGTINGAQALTLNATGAGAQVVLNGVVGGTTALTRLTTNADSIRLNGGGVTTSSDQSYGGPVTLGSNISLATTGVGAINFTDAVDSDSTARAFSVEAGGGNTTLRMQDSVGHIRALSSMNVAAAQTYWGNAVASSPVTLSAADMHFSGAVELLAPTHVNVSSQGAFTGSISGAADLVKEGNGSLLLSSSNRYSGNTTVAASTLSISNSQALGAGTRVTVANGAVLDLQGISVQSKDLMLQGGTLRGSAGNVSWSGRVTLSTDSKMESTGNRFDVTGVITPSSANVGLLMTGAGSFNVSNPLNVLSRVAAAGTVNSIDLQNSAALDVGRVTVGADTFNGLRSVGPITLTSTAPVTVSAGSAIASTGGDVVVETSRFINQAGASAIDASAGHRWQVWSTNPTPFDALQGDSPNSLSHDYVQYNVRRSTAPAVPVGRGLLFSYAPTAVASLTGVVSKIYDGTADAQLYPSNYAVSGAVNQDSLILSHPSTGRYASAGSAATVAGAGDQKAVEVSGLVLTASQAGKPVYGYAFDATVSGNVGVVQPKPLDIAFTKVYDGNPAFDARNTYVLTGVLGQESLPLISSGMASVASPNVGNYDRFVTHTLTLDNLNYTLAGGSKSATIQSAPLGIALNTLYKGKTDLMDLAAKDFTVVGLQNGETIPKIDVATLQYKEVSQNSRNYVKSIMVSAAPGVADMGNYFITQAVNPVVTASQGGNTMNMVKLIAPDEAVMLPAAPRPSLPDVAKPVSTAPLSSSSSSSSSSTTAAASTVNSTVKVETETASVSAPVPMLTVATPGVIVNTVATPSPQSNGLVTVVLPLGSANVGATGLVIGLPQSIMTPPPLAGGGESPTLNVTLPNNQPLPDWIRFDPSLKALVTTPDSRASFPITILITVGDQKTVVVVSESTQN